MDVNKCVSCLNYESLWGIYSYPLFYPNLINLTKPIYWYSVNIPISSLFRILPYLFSLISAADSILTKKKKSLFLGSDLFLPFFFFFF